MRSSVLRSLRGRLVINLESTRKLRLSRTNIVPGRKKGQKSIKSKNMARKGNPISVRLGKNRSSDSSRFSEGDRESHRMGKSFPSVYPIFSKKRGRTLQMSGTDTTSSNARRPLENTRNQSMSWKKHIGWACFDRVSGAQLNVDIINARCRIPGRETRATNPPYAPIASASRSPAPSSAGEA